VCEGCKRAERFSMTGGKWGYRELMIGPDGIATE
jgi:hypothetical protein